jgi:predicted phosphodiesterase
LAVRDYANNKDRQPYLTPADGDRVVGLTRIIEANGTRIGAIHNLERPPGPAITTPPGGLPDVQGVKVAEVIADKFGGPVDVVAYAGSHRPATVHAQGVLFVNPGSPTFPKGPGRVPGTRALGTVGILELGDESVTFETMELSLLQDAR